MEKVLVVEDNEDNRRLITYALRRSGYEVVTAGTGSKGVELALAGTFSFIIMDIDLPGIDGLEVTRRIRAAESVGKVPIVAITSYAMSGDMSKVLAAGCNGYFEKPIDPLTIVDDIRAILERSG